MSRQSAEATLTSPRAGHRRRAEPPARATRPPRPGSHRLARSVDLTGAWLTVTSNVLLVLGILLGRAPFGDVAQAGFGVLVSIALPVSVGAVVRRRSWSAGPEIALRFGLGSVLVVLVAVLLDVAGVFTVGRVALITIVLALVRALPEVWRLRDTPVRQTVTDQWHQHRRVLGLGVLGVLGPLLTVGFWRSRSPFPYQTTWDGLLHMAIVNRMLDQDEFSLSLRQISHAFSFDPYLPAFHLLVAVGSRMTGAPVLGELWIGPFLWVALATAGTYVLVRRAWNSPSAACAATFVSALMMVTRKSTNPLLNTLPASDVVVLAPLVLLLLTGRDRKLAVRRALLACAALIPIHALMGMLLVGIVITCWLLETLWQRWERHRVLLTRTLIVFGGIAVLMFILAGPLRAYAPVSALDPTQFYSSLTPSTGPRLRMYLVSSAYPPILPGIVIVAATAAFLRRRPDDQAWLVRGFPLVVWVGFTVPLVGLERLEGFLWIASTVALGWAFRELGAWASRRRQILRRWDNAPLSLVVVTLLLVPLMGIPLSTFRTFQLRDTSDHSLQSSFAPYELRLLSQFAARYGRDQRFVSDPMTQQIGEGLAGFDSIGGMSTKPSDQVLIADMFTTTHGKQARRDLSALQSEYGPFLLVATGRTVRWAAKYVDQLSDGKTPTELQFGAVFRPWSFTGLPNAVVKVPKPFLLRGVRRSRCVAGEANYAEMTIFRIDCSRTPPVS